MQGYLGIALTDHVGTGSLERVIREVAEDCRVARSRWNIMALPGVELTHIPPDAIAEAARQAKELGASIVIVHGETLVEPVEPGTNLAAVQSGDVDILAHPGLLSLEEARLAGANGVLIEISARKGHCLTNGYIARLASATGMKLVLDSDAHDSPDLLTKTLAIEILRGSGLNDGEILEVMETNPLDLVARIVPAGHS